MCASSRARVFTCVWFVSLSHDVFLQAFCVMVTWSSIACTQPQCIPPLTPLSLPLCSCLMVYAVHTSPVCTSLVTTSLAWVLCFSCTCLVLSCIFNMMRMRWYHLGVVLDVRLFSIYVLHIRRCFLLLTNRLRLWAVICNYNYLRASTHT